MEYPADDLTPAERERLRPHVSDLDGPVFALLNLPETVKGALFARYSRYPGTLRRLFLEEFAESLAPSGAAWDGEEGRRAAELYERIFVGYGDDSVAQLGGAHVACEWVSNVLTKVLQRPRLAAYLEQSTRYIAYDAPMPGAPAPGYRYYRDPELGPEYTAAMDALFATYSGALPVVRGWVDATFPRRDGESPAARERAVGAKALDLLRGLLPAASLSHMGIYASGQAYEQLILHLIGHPLPEARRYGELILAAVQAVMPSFVSRVPRPERGGAWAADLQRRRAAGERWAARLGLDRADDAGDGPSVRLLHVDGDEDALLAALLFEAAGTSEERTPLRRGGPERGGARRAAGRPGGRAREPAPSPGPGLRGRALPLRDRLGLRGVPRPPAPPAADRPVAGTHARTSAPACPKRWSRPGSATPTAERSSARAPSTRGWSRPAWPPPPPTRSASATASATSWTSTRARRCT